MLLIYNNYDTETDKYYQPYLPLKKYIYKTNLCFTQLLTTYRWVDSINI